MSVDEILAVNIRREDSTMRRERKWKEITHLFNIIRMEEYSKKSIENALWLYGTTGERIYSYLISLFVMIYRVVTLYSPLIIYYQGLL